MQVSHLLSGREICVINGPSDMTKDELERKVAEMGGIFVQNPGRHVLIDKKEINSEHFSGWHSLIKACYLCSFLLMRYEISSVIYPDNYFLMKNIILTLYRFLVSIA